MTEKINKSIIMVLILFLFSLPVFSEEKEQKKRIFVQSVTSWLVLGPFASPLPAFQKEKENTLSSEQLFLFDEVNVSSLKPKSSKAFRWHNGTLTQWKSTQTEKDGITLKTDPDNPSVAFLGFYLRVKRWTKAKITFQSSQLLKIFMDGKKVAARETFSDAEKVSAYTKLETGKHLFILKTLHDPKSEMDWNIKATISIEEKFSPPIPAHTITTEDTMSIKHLLDRPQVSHVSISHDGSITALSFRKTIPSSNSSESWLELYSVPNGTLIQSYRGDTDISRAIWAPCSKKFSYINYKDNKGTLYIVDIKNGTSEPLIQNIEGLRNHTWSPDCSFIIYSVTKKKKSERKGVKRFKNLADRQPNWRNRTFLYKVNVLGGVSQQLTDGKLSTSLNNISPDGNKILFTRSLIDYTERPYSQTELYSLELPSLKTKLLWKGKWFQHSEWGPEGKRLLMLGGPSMFGKIGVNISKKKIPNEYDTQAYIFDPDTRKVNPITKNFSPTINQAFWNKNDNCIYFITTDHSYRRLYRFNPKKETYKRIDCGVEILRQIQFSRDYKTAVFTGSSANIPPQVFILNLENDTPKLFLNPAEEEFAEVKFGKVERWTFKNNAGNDIEGRIYYPQDFNPSRKYPCIVYYYGGTTPVTREFGGRYPKNLYAANGYIVYILQPRGAVGFGQPFSAFHVNDWGKNSAEDIIEGTLKFLKEHPFVDPERIGCIGASYGGFMTMFLTTQTDLFSAAIAHAGISSIASYWGEGYWGYSYSAIASADSFPWNRKDIYVNQSPLFNAYKITTPLLLLHGSEDTNVPPGESTQLYTALKLLERDVEYIQISGENHHIMTYDKRILWTKTIIAWFDKWLKNQPEWWEDLYGE
ncbi:MAG: S9 family peptidase [Candidatus Aminicenantaceae bacterium]